MRCRVSALDSSCDTTRASKPRFASVMPRVNVESASTCTVRLSVTGARPTKASSESAEAKWRTPVAVFDSMNVPPMVQCCLSLMSMVARATSCPYSP